MVLTIGPSWRLRLLRRHPPGPPLVHSETGGGLGRARGLRAPCAGARVKRRGRRAPSLVGRDPGPCAKGLALVAEIPPAKSVIQLLR